MAVLAAVGGVVAFFLWAGRQTARAHARFGTADVEAALVEFLNPDAQYGDAWELFLAWPIDDPHLESIRQACLPIDQECQAVPGKYMREVGVTRVEALLADVRRRRATVTSGT